MTRRNHKVDPDVGFLSDFWQHGCCTVWESFRHSFVYISYFNKFYFQKIIQRGSPCGSMVKNPLVNAGDTSLSPGPGRSHMPRSNQTHAPQQLSMSSRGWEPQLLSPHACVPPLLKSVRARAHVLQQEKPLQWGARAWQLESSPCSLHLENSPHSNKDPAQPQINKAAPMAVIQLTNRLTSWSQNF